MYRHLRLKQFWFTLARMLLPIALPRTVRLFRTFNQ